MDIVKLIFGSERKKKEKQTKQNKNKGKENIISLYLEKADFLKVWSKVNMIFWTRTICWNGVFVWFGCKPSHLDLLTARLTVTASAWA